MVRRTFSLRPGLLSVLLGALLLRMLVPMGWMLAAVPGRAPALVLCDGLASAPSVQPHHGAPHAPAGHAQTSCPYAALAAPVLPPLPPVLAAAPLKSEPAPLPRLRPARVAPAAAAPSPPATGPPLFA